MSEFSKKFGFSLEVEQPQSEKYRTIPLKKQYKLQEIKPIKPRETHL